MNKLINKKLSVIKQVAFLWNLLNHIIEKRSE